MSLLLNPNAFISIDVRYYDDDEKHAFSQWSNSTKIDAVAGHTIRVPAAEFLAYFLIHKKRLSPSRYPNLDAIKRHVAKGSAQLEEWLEYDGRTLHVSADCDSLENSFSEHLGEAAGLAVANRIHNLNEADWTRIEELRGKNGRKTFDWEYASDGNNLVELEAKGGFCKHIGKLAEVSVHKQKIKDKKKDVRKLGHPRFNSSALRYGTIASVTKDPASLLTVRLVDPEGNTYFREPRDIRILKRLTWAAWLVKLLAPRTHLSVALQNRLAVLERASDIGQFDRLPLRKGNGEPLDDEHIVDWFTQNRSDAYGLEASGILTPFDADSFLFVGLSRRWLSPIILQQFDTIAELKFEAESLASIINCAIPSDQSRSEAWDLDDEEVFDESHRQRIELPGIVHQSTAGLVFGMVARSE